MRIPKNYYVTTPIYYVNGRPHIGHAYTRSRRTPWQHTTGYWAQTSAFSPERMSMGKRCMRPQRPETWSPKHTATTW